MNISEAKQIRIVDYLASIGFHPVKVRGLSHWYLAPYRNEKTPSFKVNDYRNEWYDFGTGKGGDIISLCQLLYNGVNTVSEALACLEGKANGGMRISPKTEMYNTVRETMRIVEVVPLAHQALLQYLQSRGIDLNIGRMYCREIHYTMYDKNYFGIAFQNRSGGFEIRNKFFKGCICNKDITLIPYIYGSEQTDCCIFEGFMDFLSFMTIANRQDSDYRMRIEAPCDYVVLNSVSNLGKCLKVLCNYSHIHCFLDNDDAGVRAVEQIKAIYELNTIDESFRYADCKDLNDYLLGHTR